MGSLSKYGFEIIISVRQIYWEILLNEKFPPNFASIHLDSNRASISSTPTPRLNLPRSPPRHSALRVYTPFHSPPVERASLIKRLRDETGSDVLPSPRCSFAARIRLRHSCCPPLASVKLSDF